MPANLSGAAPDKLNPNSFYAPWPEWPQPLLLIPRIILGSILLCDATAHPIGAISSSGHLKKFGGLDDTVLGTVKGFGEPCRSGRPRAILSAVLTIWGSSGGRCGRRFPVIAVPPPPRSLQSTDLGPWACCTGDTVEIGRGGMPRMYLVLQRYGRHGGIQQRSFARWIPSVRRSRRRDLACEVRDAAFWA